MMEMRLSSRVRMIGMRLEEALAGLVGRDERMELLYV